MAGQVGATGPMDGWEGTKQTHREMKVMTRLCVCSIRK